MTHELIIQREFDGGVERLFEAFSQAERLEEWFAPGEMQVANAEVDFRVGGRYRIVMRGESEHVVTGTYHEIRDNALIRSTWQWEGSELVTELKLEFSELDGHRSRLVLTHSEFPDEDIRDQHTQGWNGCLVKLNPLLSAQGNPS